MPKEINDPDSFLALYRRALHVRRTLQNAEQLEWIDTGRADVLHFRRPNGWAVVTNFVAAPYGLDGANVLIASAEITTEDLPGESTAWLGERGI